MGWGDSLAGKITCLPSLMPEFDPKKPHSCGSREPTSQSCSLTSMHTTWYKHTQTHAIHAHNINKYNLKKIKNCI